MSVRVFCRKFLYEVEQPGQEKNSVRFNRPIPPTMPGRRHAKEELPVFLEKVDEDGGSDHRRHDTDGHFGGCEDDA